MKRVLAFALFSLLAAGPVLADDSPVALVKTTSGAAFIGRGGQSLPAAVGVRILRSDVLRTEAGSLGVTFKDNTMVALGPDTELVVAEFVYEPRDNRMAFVTRMSRGTVQFTSGVIAKLAPDQMTVETPAGTVGVRGTRFLVKVDE